MFLLFIKYPGIFILILLFSQMAWLFPILTVGYQRYRDLLLFSFRLHIYVRPITDSFLMKFLSILITSFLRLQKILTEVERNLSYYFTKRMPLLPCSLYISPLKPINAIVSRISPTWNLHGLLIYFILMVSFL